jgi:hypothetical protein
MWILVGWGVAERARFLAAPRDLHGQSNCKEFSASDPDSFDTDTDPAF